MRIELTEEQHALAAVAKDLFAATSDAARLRAVWEADGEREQDLWPRLAELGLTSVCVPSEHGGMEGGLTDLVLVAEEVGYAAVPEPLLESAAVATGLLVDAGSDEQRKTWLPALAAGEARAAVAFSDQPYVLDADLADIVLVEDAGGVRLCEAGDVEVRPVGSEDRARRLFVVEEAAGEPLGGHEAPREPDRSRDRARDRARDRPRDRARDRARTVTAATLNGVSRRLVDMAVDYARLREQFDRPIGSFQAVQHLLADLHVAVESGRGAAWYAAYATDRDLDDAAVAARVSKATAADSAAATNRGVLQIFAGIGFTWEHDLHLWLKRGKALEAAHGSAREHRAALAEHLLNPAPRDEQGA